MRHQFTLMTMLLLIMMGVCTTSCEKHEGNYYFKQNCTAQLNGQSYVDQTRFEAIMSPLATVTPYLKHDEYENYLHFKTELAKDRDSAKEYYIDIYLNAKSTTELVGKEILFKKESMSGVSEDQLTSVRLTQYYKWLKENYLHFAVIGTDPYSESEVAELGRFKIESFNEKEGAYCGSFSLQFSKGTMTGKFEVPNVDRNSENN